MHVDETEDMTFTGKSDPFAEVARRGADYKAIRQFKESRRNNPRSRQAVNWR
jgi:hypothetical protein